MTYNGRIETGTTRSGAISPVGEYDSFNTTFIGGLTYTVSARGASTGNGSLGDPNLALYDSSGNRLLENDDVSPGVNRDAELTFKINSGYSGTYTLIVGEQGDNATGSYRLTVSAGYATNAADRVTGTAQNDAIHGMAGNDTLSGGDGWDFLIGGTGQDALLGGTGGDTLQGQDGNDVLRGQGGTDVLHGARGADDLYGGAGADRFVFYSHTDSNAGNGIDVIAAGDGAAAFEGVGVAGGDRINLAGIDANLNLAGNQAFVFSASRAAGTVVLSEQGSNTLLLGHVNNDGVADFQLVIADGAIRATQYSMDEFVL